MIDKQARYFGTNENIYILKYLINPSKKDTILSICGSGDIPFMILAKGSKVLTIDSEQSQIDYVNERIKSLKQGNELDFEKQYLSWEENDDYFEKNFLKRDKYFKRINKKKLKKNLVNLELVCTDIFDLKNSSDFNKVYLSNVLDHLFQHSPRPFSETSSEFFDKFKKGTQFYSSHRCSYIKPQRIAKTNGLKILTRIKWIDPKWEYIKYVK